MSELCGCAVDDDGTATLCAEHARAAMVNEWRIQQLLDAELDARIRELAGRSPTRIERKPGAIGTFAIARPKP
jgi:hypothetical protein